MFLKPCRQCDKLPTSTGEFTAFPPSTSLELDSLKVQRWDKFQTYARWHETSMRLNETGFLKPKKNVQQWLELLNFVKFTVSVEYSMIVNLVCVSQVRYSFRKGMLQNLTTLSEIDLYISARIQNKNQHPDSCIYSITCLICFGGWSRWSHYSAQFRLRRDAHRLKAMISQWLPAWHDNKVHQKGHGVNLGYDWHHDAMTPDSALW